MASGQTAEEIIQRMDDNETWTSVKMVGAMRIEDQLRTECQRIYLLQPG
jgi:hypothetical protein